MEMKDLTNEQIAKLTPDQIEQIEQVEDDAEKLAEILGKITNKAAPDDTKDEPKPAVKQGVANDAGEVDGEDEAPVVLNKSGKGIIPYEKHKELRVDNSSLREQLQASKAAEAAATAKLEDLLAKKEDATTSKGIEIADADIKAHLARLEEDMPELHAVVLAVLEGSRKQGERFDKSIAELKREKEESERERQQSVEEQVAEAKENNPDLSHWEDKDPEAWDEAIKQDEILRSTGKWAKKPYAERFEEVVRRVRAIMPEASAPKKPADPEKRKTEAKAKVDAAAERKPTTLSDIQGGGNPASEKEQLENLSGHQLTAKLMKMPAGQASLMRSEID